jgi:hypothetical protein
MRSFSRLDTEDQLVPRFRLAKLAAKVATTVGIGLALVPIPACLGVTALRAYELQQERARLASELQQLQQANQSESARRDAEFQQASVRCARRSGVRVNVKPGSRVETLGTAEQRFEFNKCMTKAGHDLE